MKAFPDGIATMRTMHAYIADVYGTQETKLPGSIEFSLTTSNWWKEGKTQIVNTIIALLVLSRRGCLIWSMPFSKYGYWRITPRSMKFLSRPGTP